MVKRLSVILAVIVPFLSLAQTSLSDELRILSDKSRSTELKIEKDARQKPGENVVRTVNRFNTVVTVSEDKSNPSAAVAGEAADSIVEASTARMAQADTVSVSRPKDDIRVDGRVVAPPVEVAQSGSTHVGMLNAVGTDAVTRASADLDLSNQRLARARARLKVVTTDSRKTIALYRQKLKKLGSTPASTEQERKQVQREMEEKQSAFDAQIEEATKAVAEAEEVVRVKQQYLQSLTAVVVADNGTPENRK